MLIVDSLINFIDFVKLILFYLLFVNFFNIVYEINNCNAYYMLVRILSRDFEVSYRWTKLIFERLVVDI